MIDWNKGTLLKWYPKLAACYAAVGLCGFWSVYLALTV